MEHKQIAEEKQFSVSDFISSIITQIGYHGLDNDDSRAMILGQLRLLKMMIFNVYGIDGIQLEVCYDEVENWLGVILSKLGYDSFEDLDF